MAADRRPASFALLAALALTSCANDVQPAANAPAPGENADAGAVTDSASVADADAASVADSGSDAEWDAGSVADSGSDSPYDHDGPVPFTVESFSVMTSGRTFTVTGYLPSPAGAHPVVSLSPGLLQPAVAYAAYGKRLASHGIATLVRDDPGALTVTTDVTADIAYTVGTWMGTALAGRVDSAHVGLAGHSRGGKATLLAAEGALHGKVHAWFGLDPVDAALFSGGAQARDTIAQIGVPTVHLGAQVSSTCAPVADNYEVLFAAGAAPSVKIIGVGVGHTQLEDPASCASCGICTPAGTADTKVVLAYALRYATAFFARELLGDARVGAAFEGAGAPGDVAAGRVQIVTK